ncbi:hypothetical protein [Petrachloros mirabilis]
MKPSDVLTNAAMQGTHSISTTMQPDLAQIAIDRIGERYYAVPGQRHDHDVRDGKI